MRSCRSTLSQMLAMMAMPIGTLTGRRPCMISVQYLALKLQQKSILYKICGKWNLKERRANRNWVSDIFHMACTSPSQFNDLSHLLLHHQPWLVHGLGRPTRAITGLRFYVDRNGDADPACVLLEHREVKEQIHGQRLQRLGILTCEFCM